MSRRARWICALAVLSILSALVVLWVSKSERPARIAMQVLGETNGWRTVVVTNLTHKTHYLSAWAEFGTTNGTWARDSSKTGIGWRSIEPSESITFAVPMINAQDKQRITLWCSPVKDHWESSIDDLKALMGSKASRTYELHVEVDGPRRTGGNP